MTCGDDGEWIGFSCANEHSRAEAPCGMSEAEVQLPNWLAIQANLVEGCGYVSRHGAECEFTCKRGIPVGPNFR
jgi:hypothetical protein